MCDRRHSGSLCATQAWTNSLQRGYRPPPCGMAAANLDTCGLFGKYRPYSKVPSVISASMRSSSACSFLRFAGVSGRAVCSRQRLPRYRKSKNRCPVSGRGKMLPTTDPAAGHGDHLSHFGGLLSHILFDGLPDVEDLPATKGAEIMPPLQQNRVLEPVPDGPGVVFDAGGQLICGQIGRWLNRLRWATLNVGLHKCHPPINNAILNSIIDGEITLCKTKSYLLYKYFILDDIL